MNSTCKKSNMLRGLRRKTRGLAFMAAAAAFALLHPGVSQAAVITWNTAEDITDASDVYTAGSLEYAVTFGSAVSYGGVAFSAETYTKTQPVGTGETLTLTDIDLLNWSRNVFDFSSPTTPFSGLDANYQTLLAHIAATDNNAGSSVRLKGLTIGKDYAVQVWLNRSIDAATNVGLIDGNNVDLNTTDAIGGTGQYIVGTFTADAVMQSFTVGNTGGGAGRGGFNAIQVRDVTIPEPGTLGLFGMAALIVTALRRRATLR